MPQRTLGESLAEKECRQRIAEGMRLIEEEEMKGLARKKERERKKIMKKRKAQSAENEDQTEDDDTTNDEGGGRKNSFNGPCVIYLSPSEESRIALESLRETLREELFPMYDAFSPSSSVSPYPEHLPRKVVSDKEGASTSNAIKFKPLLPIGRFASVDAAVKVAKILQRTWDPLTFKVTDIQFVSRQDDYSSQVNLYHGSSASGVGFGNAGKSQSSSDWDIPEFRHRRKHGTLLSKEAANRMALSSGGEVEDVSKQGIYGCDAMVMMWGEEPEEELMDEDASLTMLMDDGDIENLGSDFNEHHTDEIYYQTGDINYDEIFATAEREYQRMEAYEEFSSVFDLEPGARIEQGEEGGGIEAWLDDGDGAFDDEGATVVIGRAQFFMGAMRDFIGMPASSTIDSKDR
jgi:hypothetical protein